MNHIGTVPMRTRPLSYQPLRAGQFRGYGGCNVFPSRTTIVNNNIYGNYGYDYGCCGGYDDGGMSKGMKWMMGFAIGLPIIGSILSAFGIGQGGGGRVDGQGGEEPPANDQSDLIKDLTQQVKDLTATVEDLKNGKNNPVKEPPAKEEVQEEEPAEEVSETPKIDFSKVKDGEIMNCIDRGGPRPINGKLSNVQTNEKGVPTSFTITDTSENKKGNTYEYVLDTTADDGTPSYKCVKKNGQNVIGEHKYAFKDGKLVQENDKFAGYGVGVKTAADTKPPVNKDQKYDEYFKQHNVTVTKVTQNGRTYFKASNGMIHNSKQGIYDMMITNEKNGFGSESVASSTVKPSQSSNQEAKLRYEYKDHLGHYYINDKEVDVYKYMKAQKEAEARKNEQAKLNSPLSDAMEKNYDTLTEKVNSNSNLTQEQKTQILNRIATAKNNSKTQGSFWNSNGLNFYNKISQELMNENIV